MVLYNPDRKLESPFSFQIQTMQQSKTDFYLEKRYWPFRSSILLHCAVERKTKKNTKVDKNYLYLVKVAWKRSL